MLQYIEPFVVRPIETFHTEDEVTSYFDVDGELLAEAYCNEGQLYSVVFYGTSKEQTHITKLQAEKITKKVQIIFQQETLTIESIKLIDDEFFVSLIMREPVYNVPISNSGMNITISCTGFVEEIALQDNDFTIIYPEKFISKEQASAKLKQQPLLKLGIAPELDWQYVYMKNYDLYGIDPDGKVRLWSEDELTKDASFEALPEVDEIDDLESFLQGGRAEPVETAHTDNNKQWRIPTCEQLALQENSFIRACKVVKNLVGEQYKHYFVEQYDTLKKLLALEEEAFVTYRFVYIFNDISFDFQAISISVDTQTNQISSVAYPHIPFDKFLTLPLPTMTLEQANSMA